MDFRSFDPYRLAEVAIGSCEGVNIQLALLHANLHTVPGDRRFHQLCNPIFTIYLRIAFRVEWMSSKNKIVHVSRSSIT